MILDHRIRLEDIASYLAAPTYFLLNASYFSQLFKKKTGMTYQNYLTEYRIDRARDLLSSTASPVADIAAEVGYDDPKYFMRVFKRRTGLTPGQYRDAFPARLFNAE